MSNTSTSMPLDGSPSASTTSASVGAVRWLCGVFARSRAIEVASARRRPRSTPASTSAVAPSLTRVSDVSGAPSRRAAQRVVGVAGEDGPFDRRLADEPGSQAVDLGHDEGQRPPSKRVARRQRPAAAFTHVLAVDRGRVADPEGHERARSSRQEQGAADGAVEPEGGELRPDRGRAPPARGRPTARRRAGPAGATAPTCTASPARVPTDGTTRRTSDCSPMAVLISSAPDEGSDPWSTGR